MAEPERQATNEKGFAEKIEDIHAAVVGAPRETKATPAEEPREGPEGTGRPRGVIVFPIDYPTQTAEFEIDFEEEIGTPAQFLNIESDVACTLKIKWLGTAGWSPYPKGLQADVPLEVETTRPWIRAIKVTPSASANIQGIATAPAALVKEGR